MEHTRLKNMAICRRKLPSVPVQVKDSAISFKYNTKEVKLTFQKHLLVLRFYLLSVCSKKIEKYSRRLEANFVKSTIKKSISSDIQFNKTSNVYIL